MKEDELDKIERMTIRLFLIIILVWVTIMLFRSCSVSYIKIKNSKDIKVKSVLDEPNDSIAGGIVKGAVKVIETVEDATVGNVRTGIKVIGDTIKKKRNKDSLK